MESMPIQYAINPSIECPTGGWELAHDATQKAGDQVTSVYCTLTRPGKDELVIQVIQTQTCRIELGTNVAKQIQVYVRQAERGVQPTADGYRLARTVAIP
jgi:hypothetical protein